MSWLQPSDFSNGLYASISEYIAATGRICCGLYKLPVTEERRKGRGGEGERGREIVAKW
jgi:hypothetical protein